jgi:hypothetical protein
MKFVRNTVSPILGGFVVGVLSVATVGELVTLSPTEAVLVGGLSAAVVGILVREAIRD